MQDIASKLGSLGYHPLKPNVSVPLSQIELLQKIEFSLPRDYQEFLSRFPETGIFDKQVVFSGIERSPWAANGREVLEVLYAQCPSHENDLLALRTQYVGRLSNHFLIIGQVTGANFVCMDLRTNSYGQVYVWDHEHIVDSSDGFYLAAPNFSSFVESLREFKPERATDGPKLVKKEFSDTLTARATELLKKNRP